MGQDSPSRSARVPARTLRWYSTGSMSLDALTPRSRSASRTLHGILMGSNVFFAGLWLDEEWMQAGGLALAALSPLIARWKRDRREPWESLLDEPPRLLPAVSESPPRAQHHHFIATYQLAQARAEARDPAVSKLSGAVPSKNARYRALLDRIEAKSRVSVSCILLLGPTGAGKSELARGIHEVRKAAGLLSGAFVEVNCAQLKNEPYLNSLFGHVKGAYTGAQGERDGLLWRARGGTLFFDEIGELSLDQQAMLLTLMNNKRYRQMGSDEELTSDATFMFATLRDLDQMVEDDTFRVDFLARINTYTYTLPSLSERPEDFDALIDFQLEVLALAYRKPVTFEAEAREAYLAACRSPLVTWTDNLRGLAASLERVTANDARRADLAEVEAEAEELRRRYAPRTRKAVNEPVAVVSSPAPSSLARIEAEEEAELPPSVRGRLGRPERGEVLLYVRPCRALPSLPDAAEYVYHLDLETSRRVKAERLRKQLAKFGLTYESARET